MEPDPVAERFLSFDAFILDLDGEELRRNGRPIKLQAQPFKVLALLASRAGRPVTREEIRKEVWTDETFVDFDKGIYYCIKAIRTALGDDAEKPQFLETLPGKGYRFLAPVEAAPEEKLSTPARLPKRAAFAFVFLLLILALWGTYRTTKHPTPAPVLRTKISLPEGEDIFDWPSITPDGNRLVYSSARVGEGTRLVVRDLATGRSTPIPGTEGAWAQFLSPDGQWVAFVAHRKLKKAPIDGGVGAIELCESPRGGGGYWSRDDTIYFSEYYSIKKISASGGTAEEITHINADEGERTHRWPSLTHDGKTLIFAISTGASKDDSLIVAQSLETGERQFLTNAASARILKSGHLLYTKERTLFAAAFDPATMELLGPGVPVQPDVETSSFSRGAPNFDVSSNGTLVYLPVVHHPRKLVLVDLQGRAQILPGPSLPYAQPRFSPDGNLVVMMVDDMTLQVYDLERENLMLWLSEFRDEKGNTWKSLGCPVWSPDGNRIAFSGTSARASYDVFVAPFDQTTPPTRMTQGDFFQYVWAWSPVSDELVTTELHSGTTSWDLYAVSASDSASVRPLAVDKGRQEQPALSPDGRWIAYISSGRVYVQSFQGKSKKLQVSRERGGSRPLWAPDGKGLYYRSPTHMMAVDVAADPNLSVGLPQALFEAGDFRQGMNMDLAPDGKHFIMIRDEQLKPRELHIVLNWLNELERLVPKK